MYNKLFTKILDSSIWLENQPTRIVWITFIAMMDMDGMVALSSIGNVANRARVSEQEATDAINCLENPDHHNPDQDHEGRRIERIPGTGWIVLNAAKYRDIVKADVARAMNRERVTRHRANAKKPERNDDVMVCNDSVMQSESDHTQNLKRLINEAIEKFSEQDSRVVEIATIETIRNRTEDSEPIRSLNYLLPQIKRACLGAAKLKNSDNLNDLLQRRRQQAGLEP